MELSLSRKVLIGILVICLGLAIVGTTIFLKKKDQGERDVATSIFTSNEAFATYTDILGNPVALEDYLGQLVVATTWASWSPFSATDLPALDRLASQYQREAVFLAINRKENREQAARYIETLPELKNVIVVIDIEDKFYTLTGGYAMPETVVFDKEGQIIVHQRGELRVDEITSLLKTDDSP